jgi:hypothetical protein
MKYLGPNLTCEPWTADEDQVLVEKFKELGPHWSQIASFLPKRSSYAVKNRWHAQHQPRANDPKCDSEVKADVSAEAFPLPAQPATKMSSFLAMLLNP